MSQLGRSQDAYDHFSVAVDVPLTVLAVLWLPVLVVPLVTRVSTGTADTLQGSTTPSGLSSRSSTWSSCTSRRLAGRSSAGRGVAVVLMITGIGLVGVLSATVASYFVGQRADQDMTELHRRLDRIEAALARLGPPEPTQQPPEPPQDDQARGDLRCIR
jgi:hypothetical protein